MLLEDAVALRIEQLCIEKNMSKYDLFLKSVTSQFFVIRLSYCR